MKFNVVTLFPKMFEAPLAEGVVGQAFKSQKLSLKLWDPRQFTTDTHKTVDDRPYGGGDGMVMLPEVLKKTLDAIKLAEGSPVKGSSAPTRRRTIYLSPQGKTLSDQKAQQLVRDYDEITLLCGRYGGIDERLLESEIDEELSIGDYVLSGGELAALVLIDTMARFIPGVLGHSESALNDSFQDQLLEHPLFTRPREFEGRSVPEVLFSGHHQKIKQWQRQEQIKRTLKKRPDLIAHAQVTREEIDAAARDLGLGKNIAVGLVHYPVYNKSGSVTATNVTQLDVHDIARVCRTYGIDRYCIITPAQEQLSFVGRMLEHWQTGRGLSYNPCRSDSLSNVHLNLSVEEAVERFRVEQNISGKIHLVATSARSVVGPKPLSFQGLTEISARESVFLIFGTGYGLENSLVRDCDYLLEPIRGRSSDGFRHLSVRSAVSITLDRLFGSCY